MQRVMKQVEHETTENLKLAVVKKNIYYKYLVKIVCMFLEN